MKILFKILIILIAPIALFAQDTAVVKKKAELMAKAFLKGDYKILADYTYPRMVLAMGGKEKMISLTSNGMAQMKAQGVTFESVTIGHPGKFYKAGKEIHCLVPEILTIKLPNSRVTQTNYLLAISSDGGKNWSFLDLNKGTIPKIPQLFPNFNPNLKIPEPTQPVMQQ